MRWRWVSVVVFTLSVASCDADTLDNGPTSTTGSHGTGSTSQPAPAEPLPPTQTLSLSSTEVSRARLDLRPAGLEAELVRDDLDRAHRAEGVWGVMGAPWNEPARLRAGSSVEVSFSSTLDLGGAGGSDIWAVSWQLIGPNDDGSWPAPPLALTVGNGQWRIGGGAGHPDGSQEDYADIGIPFHDGQTIAWVIHVTIEPDAGAVDVWADGEHVVKAWQPPGGTLYPEQPYLLMKTGLYTGGGGAAGRPSEIVITDAHATMRGAPEQ